MDKTKKEKTAIEQAGEDLLNFAVDRQDVKTILDLLPAEAEIYWQAVREFSWSLSETTGLTGQDIDYFQILKERLDMYLAAMDMNPAAPEPAAVIGPEFVRACGNVDDMFTVMTGARMCVATLESTREYLETLERG